MTILERSRIIQHEFLFMYFDDTNSNHRIYIHCLGSISIL